MNQQEFAWYRSYRKTGHETARIPCVSFAQRTKTLAMPVYKAPLSRARSIKREMMVKIIAGYRLLVSQRSSWTKSIDLTGERKLDETDGHI